MNRPFPLQISRLKNNFQSWSGSSLQSKLRCSCKNKWILFLMDQLHVQFLNGKFIYQNQKIKFSDPCDKGSLAVVVFSGQQQEQWQCPLRARLGFANKVRQTWRSGKKKRRNNRSPKGSFRKDATAERNWLSYTGDCFATLAITLSVAQQLPTVLSQASYLRLLSQVYFLIPALSNAALNSRALRKCWL